VKRSLILLGVGCALVGAAWLVTLFVHGGWVLFAFITGGLAVFFLILFRGAMSGEDKERPPGAARVSAARWAGPLDPDELAAGEHALEPDHEAAAEARADEVSSALGYLLVAAPLVAAAIVCVVLYA
jgi:hypothetical protein